MGIIDEQKEKINSLRFYLGLVVAMILAIGSGVAKLFNSGLFGTSFFLGVFFIVLLIVVFGMIARLKHQAIRELRDMK